MFCVVSSGCQDNPQGSKTPPQATPAGGSGGRPASTPARPRASSAADSQPTLARFDDVTAASGVHSVYRDGQEAGHFAIVESLGGGVGMVDFDADGLLDLFFPGGGRYEGQALVGHPSTLFRNLGSMLFQEVAAPAGVAAAPRYTHGTAMGDYDDDGFRDVLVTGYGGVLLFHNQGDGTFVEMAQPSGMADSLWSSSAGWGDLDGDLVLDVYIAHYVNWSFQNHPFCDGPEAGSREVCPPRRFEGLPDMVYYGNGDGTFRDASQEFGVQPDGKGLGVVLGDLDLDGRLDVYVGNDTVPNFLFRNRGNGTFEEVGQLSGTALSDKATPDGSMGVDIGDFNLDGLPDLWVANYENESIALYRNEGDCQFLHVSRSTGVTAVGALFVSFGTLFLDFDRDGDEDVFVTNGHVIRYPVNAPLRETPLLFENRGGRLRNVAPQAGPYCAEPHMGRGVAGGDLDNDGDIDLALAPINEPAAVLANQTPNDNGWLRVRPIGVRSPRDAVGARLTLETSSGRQTRQIKGGGSYLSQSDLDAFFGIPRGATLTRLTIYWPAGGVLVLTDLGPNRLVTVVEDD